MNQPILNHCIKGKPKFNIKDCLSYYDNSRLVEIAKKQHLLLNMGAPIKLDKLNRKETINHLYTRIYTHFEKDLFYLPPREIEFVSKLMSTDFKGGEWVDYKDCSFLHSLGYVHLYYYNDQVYPILPKELRKIYSQIPKDELDSETKLNNRFYYYAVALTQLHGIYTLDHFMEVWNLYNDEKIDFGDALTYFDMMYDRQDYFNYDYQYVVTNYPTNEDGYSLLDGKEDQPYYIPTKAQILQYSKEPLGKNSPYYDRLTKSI